MRFCALPEFRRSSVKAQKESKVLETMQGPLNGYPFSLNREIKDYGKLSTESMANAYL